MLTIACLPLITTLGCVGFGTAEPLPLSDWKPVPGHIMTRWAKDVKPDQPWPEYPRPTMVRDKWENLNGLWDYSVVTTAEPATVKQAGRILVPYPIESSLSGVGRPLSPGETLVYRRSFTIPIDWVKRRIVLHFGAVDWQARVKVNGREIGEHSGGYAPFQFDITDALKEGENELTVSVTDPTDTGGQPRGKQWLKPHGIWYTPTSGIWQTVWLEPVEHTGWVKSIKIQPNAAEGWVEITADVDGLAGRDGVLIEITASGKKMAEGLHPDGRPARIKIPDPHVWTPQDPFLYDVTIRVKQGADIFDTVKTYFALRDVNLAKDAEGINRLTLNGKPTFMFGPLDQGFWPDGLYTPPTDEAMKFDIEAVKKMGGNMLRKHVKVEPERFYWWCDKIGVMVWQDIPSPFYFDGKGNNPHRQPELGEKWKQNFERETKEIIESRANHSSIVMWVPFNEGWGQNDLPWCKSVVEMVKKLDPSRLINNASGWTDMHVGDVNDIHIYPGPATTATETARAVVLGEYGGLGLPLDGHTWVSKDNWGYVSYKSPQELTDAYVKQIAQLPLLASQGLSAAVYTQTTDVEIECNGWLTYDREVWKVDPVRAAEATQALYKPWPRFTVLVPRAGTQKTGNWSYTTQSPGEGWFLPEFDSHAWKEGPAGFGTPGTPSAHIGTEWPTSDIWIRRSFELKSIPSGQVSLDIHHDEDAEVYINGELIASLKNYTTAYTHVPLDAKATKALKAGTNTIAIHCHQTTGGQYIDCGIVEISPAK
ncbi:MAG: sugar-binding domain-containing protein [Phycisphaerales bacterium]